MSAVRECALEDDSDNDLILIHCEKKRVEISGSGWDNTSERGSQSRIKLLLWKIVGGSPSYFHTTVLFPKSFGRDLSDTEDVLYF